MNFGHGQHWHADANTSLLHRHRQITTIPVKVTVYIRFKGKKRHESIQLEQIGVKQKRPESIKVISKKSCRFDGLIIWSLHFGSVSFFHLRDLVNSTCLSRLRACLVHQHTNAKQLHMHRVVLYNTYIVYVPALRQSRKLNEFSQFCQALNGRLHSCIYQPSLIKTQ